MADPSTSDPPVVTEATPPPAPDAAPTEAAAPAAPPVVAAPAPPPPPAEVSAAPRSRAWLGVLAAFVAIALLAGATAALFVRVRDAQETADDAVVLATDQSGVEARLADLDASLAAVATDGTATADELADARDQVRALRRCVNDALDAWSEATQAGRPVAISKC